MGKVRKAKREEKQTNVGYINVISIYRVFKEQTCFSIVDVLFLFKRYIDRNNFTRGVIGLMLTVGYYGK